MNGTEQRATGSRAADAKQTWLICGRPDDPAASGTCGCCTRNQAWRNGRSMGGSWRAQAQPERAWNCFII